IRENTLMAQALESSKAQLVGDVFPVADGVSLTTVGSYAPVSVSDQGMLVYEAGGTGGRTEISWFDRSGKMLGQPLATGPGLLEYPAIAPDEKSVVFAREMQNSSDLWLRDLVRGTDTRFTSDVSNQRAPVWSPRGDRIVFSSNRKGNKSNLYWKTTNGSG